MHDRQPATVRNLCARRPKCTPQLLTSAVAPAPKTTEKQLYEGDCSAYDEIPGVWRQLQAPHVRMDKYYFDIVAVILQEAVSFFVARVPSTSTAVFP